MRRGPATVRVRAWFLRTFRGRKVEDAVWVDETPVAAGAPESFTLGVLRIDVEPRGLKAAGINPAALVYEVRITREDDPRAWSSRYGFPPTVETSARAAAEAALDELDEIFRDRETWRARVTEGMTDDEAEAMEDSPALRLDVVAAEWVGPELVPHRSRRAAGESWLPGD